MKRMKKLCLFLAALLTGGFTLMACDIQPNTDSESLLQGSSWESISSADSSSSDESSSTSDSLDSSEIENIIPDPDPEMQAIVDELYALSYGESMPLSSYTLTGIVTATGRQGKKDTITFTVVGREDKPVYCYGIVGGDVDSVRIGDVVTVSGSLKRYDGSTATYYEFDNGCTLDKWLSNWKDEDNDGNDGDTDGDGTEILPYTPATSNEEAKQRTASYQLSGNPNVPDQAPTLAENQPKEGNVFIRNSVMQFSENGNAYTIVDYTGASAFTVYKDGAYITLEEVAAYVYAFGTYPANYTQSKYTSPTESGWGKYLRVNHTSFSGDTSKYPYEPVLPNISGCGGKLHYYEMDIGTTGTDCDPSFPVKLYNNGSSITRGAARIVYGKEDLNGNGVYEYGEFHVFYTYNHYNDFQEYLNYQGGWGEIFGNITGGGSISSTHDYNPTKYVATVWGEIPSTLSLMTASVDIRDYKTLIKGSI